MRHCQQDGIPKMNTNKGRAFDRESPTCAAMGNPCQPHQRWRAGLILCAAVIAGCTGPAAAALRVDWSSCPVSRSAAVSALVAADPEWLRSGRMHDAAISAVRGLVAAGADNVSRSRPAL